MKQGKIIRNGPPTPQPAASSAEVPTLDVPVD
jgi:hypothetical protein